MSENQRVFQFRHLKKGDPQGFLFEKKDGAWSKVFINEQKKSYDKIAARAAITGTFKNNPDGLRWETTEKTIEDFDKEEKPVEEEKKEKKKKATTKKTAKPKGKAAAPTPAETEAKVAEKKKAAGKKKPAEKKLETRSKTVDVPEPKKPETKKPAAAVKPAVVEETEKPKRKWKGKALAGAAGVAGLYGLLSGGEEKAPQREGYNPQGAKSADLDQIAAAFGDQSGPALDKYLADMKSRPPEEPEEKKFGKQEILLALANTLANVGDNDGYGDILAGFSQSLIGGQANVRAENEAAGKQYTADTNQHLDDLAGIEYKGAVEQQGNKISALNSASELGLGGAVQKGLADKTGDFHTQQKLTAERVLSILSPQDQFDTYEAVVSGYPENQRPLPGSPEAMELMKSFISSQMQFHEKNPYALEQLQKYPHQGQQPEQPALGDVAKLGL